MAVVENKVSSDLVLQLQSGTDAKGNPLYVTRTYKGVKTGALDQDIYDVAQALAGLQKDTLMAVRRDDVEELTVA